MRSSVFVVLALVAIFTAPVFAEDAATAAPADGQAVDAAAPAVPVNPDAKITMTVDFTPETCDKKSVNGNYLHVHYTGVIDESSAAGEKGKQFDSTLTDDKHEAFKFTLGESQVVQGWEQGLLGMCVGEKRTLVVPPELAYGEFGAGESIPGGSTLKFNIELVKLEDKAPQDTSLFDEIDKDSDKKLSREEIKAWLGSNQELDDKLANETADSTMESEDSNKDGFIDFDEFMATAGAADKEDDDDDDDDDDKDDDLLDPKLPEDAEDAEAPKAPEAEATQATEAPKADL